MNKIDKYTNRINSKLVSRSAIREVSKVLSQGLLSKPHGGPYVKKFQAKISALLNKDYCFATPSGTSSLHAAIALLNLKEGDEVLVSGWTFIADASVVMQEKGTPVFVDVSEDDFNIDPEDAARKITSKTRAIIAVHMFGQPARMNELRMIAKKNNLILIEDAAQAFGAVYHGKPVGSLGDIAILSFFQTKHLAAGEGGMIIVGDKTKSDSLKSILNSGISSLNFDEYDFDRIGFNYQMTEINAAILLDQLKHYKKLNETRRKYAEIYKRTLKNTGISFQKEEKGTTNVYLTLTGIVPKDFSTKRDLLVKKALDIGIPLKKQYPLALTETKLIKSRFGDLTDKTPVSVDCARRVLNFAVNPQLPERDIRLFANEFLKLYQSLY